MLHALETSPRPLTLSEVAKESGIATSNARFYLVSLMRVGAVTQTAYGRYKLGPAALRIGLAQEVVPNEQLHERAFAMASELAKGAVLAQAICKAGNSAAIPARSTATPATRRTAPAPSESTRIYKRRSHRFYHT